MCICPYQPRIRTQSNALCKGGRKARGYHPNLDAALPGFNSQLYFLLACDLTVLCLSLLVYEMEGAHCEFCSLRRVKGVPRRAPGQEHLGEGPRSLPVPLTKPRPTPESPPIASAIVALLCGSRWCSEAKAH